MSQASHLKPVGLLTRYSHFAIPAIGCFVLGNVLAAYQPGLSWLAPWVAGSWICIFLGVAVLALSGSRWVVMACLWLVFTILGGLYFSHISWWTKPGSVDVSRFAPAVAVRVEGELLPYGVGSNRVVLQVSTVNHQPAAGKLQFKTSRFPLPAPGSWIALEGRLALPRVNPIPGGFDETRYLHSQNITAVLKQVSALTVTQSEPVTWQGHLNRWLAGTRASLVKAFSTYLPASEAAVLGGVVLGDHAVPVDKSLRRQFTETGLVHLLAASGMNVGIVAGFIFFLCQRLLRWPMRATLPVAMLAVGLYALLTGLPPSIQRAAWMLELALLFKWMNRQLTPLYSLCLAVLALVLWNPVIVTSIGFQLSVVTTLGLITMVPPLIPPLGHYITQWAAGGLLIPLVAQIWVFPLLVTYFNQCPLHSVLLNILVVPLVTVMTCVGFVAGMAGLFWPALAAGLAWLAWPFVSALLWLVQLGSGWRWAQWSLPSFDPGQLALLYGMLLFVAYGLSEPGRLWLGEQKTRCFSRYPVFERPLVQASGICLALSLLILFITWSERMRTSQTTIDILPLAHQQQAFIIRPAHTAQVLAILPEKLSWWQGKDILDYLKHLNIRQLDAVLTTDTPEQSDGLGMLTDAGVMNQVLDSSSAQEIVWHSLKLQTKGGLKALWSQQHCIVGLLSGCVFRQLPMRIGALRQNPGRTVSIQIREQQLYIY